MNDINIALDAIAKVWWVALIVLVPYTCFVFFLGRKSRNEDVLKWKKDANALSSELARKTRDLQDHEEELRLTRKIRVMFMRNVILPAADSLMEDVRKGKTAPRRQMYEFLKLLVPLWSDYAVLTELEQVKAYLEKRLHTHNKSLLLGWSRSGSQDMLVFRLKLTGGPNNNPFIVDLDTDI